MIAVTGTVLGVVFLVLPLVAAGAQPAFDEPALQLRTGADLRGSAGSSALGAPLSRSDDDGVAQRLRPDRNLTPTIESSGGILPGVPRSPADVDDAISDDGPVSNRSVVGPSVAGEPAQPARTATGTWRFVPIPWAGSLGSDYGFSSGDSGASTFSQSERLGLRANTFVWQPWFARVGGSLSLVRTSVSADTESKATSIGVGSRVSLFPQSRFPVDAFFDVNSSSAAAGSGLTSNYSSQLFGVSNSYRPEDASFTSTGNFQFSSFDSGNGAKSSQMQVNASYVPRIATEMPQSLSTDASYSIGKSDPIAAPAGGNASGGTQTGNLRLRATHSLNLEDWYGLMLNSEATYDNNSRRGDAIDEISTSIAQLQTSFNWQPDEDLPLRLTGSVRAQQFATKVGSQDFTINSLFGQVATSYSLTPQWSVSGGLSASLVTSEAASVSAVSANAGINYRGLAIDFDGFTYNYGAGATSSVTVQSQGQSTQSVGGSFSHGVSRSIDTGRFGPLTLNLTQSYSTSVSNADRGNVFGVGTGASLGWSLPSTGRYSISASINGSDSRSFGDDSAGSQSFGAVVSGTFPLSAYSSAGANLNANFSRRLESTETLDGFKRSTPAEEWLGYGGGQVTYQNSRFFGMPRLEYSANYNLSIRSASSVNQLAGQVVNQPGPSTSASSGRYLLDHVLTQYVNYSLGRLSFRLSNNISIADGGSKSFSVFLSVNRELGGVLNF